MATLHYLRLNTMSCSDDNRFWDESCPTKLSWTGCGWSKQGHEPRVLIWIGRTTSYNSGLELLGICSTFWNFRSNYYQSDKSTRLINISLLALWVKKFTERECRAGKQILASTSTVFLFKTCSVFCHFSTYKMNSKPLNHHHLPHAPPPPPKKKV